MARLAPLMMSAALAACSQADGLSQLSLLSGGPDITASAAENEATAEGVPPLPVRNTRGAAGGGEDETRQSGLSLPNLSDVDLLSPSPYAPDETQWQGRPVAVYTQLAQRIRSCWLSPASPKLADHGFHAEVAAGDPDEATIIIYKNAKNGRRGLQAFRITIDGKLTGSTVKARNRRLEKALEEAFKADLARWSKGQQNCQS